MPRKVNRANFRLRKAVGMPGIAGKRARTFKPGQEEDLEEYVNEYNEEAKATAGSDAPVDAIDLDATLSRPGVVALDEDATQDELDESLSALRNLTMAAPERTALWSQRIAKPEDVPEDEEDDGPPSRPASRRPKVAGAKRARTKK